MKAQDSLEYLLPLFPAFIPENFIRSEVSALKTVVADILLEIRKRDSLEEILLSSLEKRVSHLKSELMNLQSSYNIIRYFNRLERIIALEHDLEKAQLEKIRTQEATAKDLLELKKLLWRYWLLLHKKEAQIYFFYKMEKPLMTNFGDKRKEATQEGTSTEGTYSTSLYIKQSIE